MSAHKWNSTGSIEVDMTQTPKKNGADHGPSGGKQKSRSRYDDALRNFLPMGPAPKSPEDDRPNVKVIPNGSVSVFSYLWANWLSATMWKAWKTGLSPDDLWDLRGADKSEATAKRLRAAWDAELKKKGPQEASLFSACLRAMRTRLLVSVVFMMISTVFQFLAPTWVVKSLLDFVASNGNADAAERLPLSWGLTLVALLACCLLARNVTQNAMLAVGAHTGARVIGGLQVLAYERVLSWRTAAGDSDLLVGQLTNFCANDMDRVLEAVYLAPMIMSVPVMFVACMAYAIHIMGAWVLLGIFTIFLFYPLMSGLAAFVSRSRQVTARLTDKRISLVGELCAHIRLVKIYAWEQYLKERINDLRKPEQKAQEKAAFLQSITMTLTGSVAILAAVVTFLAYSLAGNELDAAAVFTVFSIFGAFQFSLGILPQTVRVIAEAAVALRRLKKLILFDPPEIGAAGLSHDPCNAIELEKASFVWDTENWESVDETPVKKKNKKKKAARGRRNKKVENGTVNQKLEEEEQVELNTSVPEDKKIKENLVLKDINLVVPRQGLVGLCGPVGCGKSSLIAAISGNLREVKSENCRRISGRIAVVSQTPWIFNATLRENVLFGLDYDAERYERVLEACCLQRDVDSLPNGDETEIGERGVNLSGGQKQRVNLARAVYADRDIYLLDDCLSAVDPEVSRDIFALCIRGLLKGKAVLLASHSLQLLEECGYVYYLEGGRIASEGLYEDLVADTEGRFMSLVKYDRTRGLKGGAESRRAATGGGGGEADAGDSIHRDRTGGQLIGEETSATGGVTMNTYWSYYRRWGNVCAATLCMIVVLAYCLARIVIPRWLQLWIDDSAIGGEDGQTLEEDTHIYRIVLTALAANVILVGLAQGYVMCRQLLVASSKLHEEMLNSIIRAPMSFFDSTPTGRIMNRFSRDVDELDVRMPFLCSMVTQGILNVFLQLVAICFDYAYFTAPFCVILVLFLAFDYWLNVGVREVKRVDNVTRSVIIQHIDMTVSGLSVIHSYEKETEFMDKFSGLVNRHTSAVLLYRHTSRWFQCRLELLGNIAILATSLIIVLGDGGQTTAVAGVALNYVFQSCGFLPFLLRVKSEFQARMTSVERMVEYIEDVPQESPSTSIGDSELDPKWPEKGRVAFRHFCCRYRPDLPFALNDVDFLVEAGEKVGIVGRTGAGLSLIFANGHLGKSSLIYALLRMIEAESGCIEVDGVDIGGVGLKRLRDGVAVIPQDPTLFRGTIRSNLDPSASEKDEALWQALDQAHLKPVIAGMPAGLDSVIGGDDKKTGAHLSVGQRQLLCLARALLKKSRILVLDEATASVDVRTDALIQETLRTTFVDATVLTIAHRLHTVLHYDKILVMDRGTVAEFGAPLDLMSSEAGAFKALMETIGIRTVEQFQEFSPENLPFIDADEPSSASSGSGDRYSSCDTNDVDE
ncbi:unnamed protein product [Notodromas monacha]|uniref:Uncharacterized protein n=1 Tax=Notodromas monacha TaxID=399045 RepID=A0A7R9BFG5_9CRUS|nr:unnamed protein product [Notodromas monacha]CAG0914441.1 unnamed protein product [Notodromas monacha]